MPSFHIEALKSAKFHAKTGYTLKNYILWIDIMASTILENKMFWKIETSKNVYNQRCSPDPISSIENHVQKDWSNI